jgi:SAM-dependent methyltransferase
MNDTVQIYARMKARLKEKYPNFAPLWTSAEREGGQKWLQEFSEHLNSVFGASGERGIWEAVDGYAEFCTEAVRSQIYFEKHGRYKASNYAEVLKECYHSEDYMDRRYLPGQFLSHFVWPHHRRMLNGFVREFLPQAGKIDLFYEVGVGCGMYSLKTLQALPGSTGVGFDISQYALDFTKRVIDAHGIGSRYSICNQDIIASPPNKRADFIISQEVLEHLEDPPAFIRALKRMVKPGGYGYITAAINAGHTDHIYLYRSAEEVARQIKDAGWAIKAEQIECNYPDKPIEKRPTVAGFLVTSQ